jgi:PD-(D/E)XK endonuclease
MEHTFWPNLPVRSRAVTSRTSGNPGEAAVLGALVKRGFDVLVPFGDGHPYDLVVHVARGTFLRVQCKTAWSRGGCLVFRCHMTDHGRGPLPYGGLADIFGVYFPPRDSVYLVPVDAIAESEGRLRLEPARNNQRRRIRLAADFELARWSPDALCKVANGAMPVSEAA